MQAMILAAGFGTRLLPHTRQKPKPLFPVLNQPLLLITIRRLQRMGFDHIIVNCHHLKEQVAAAVAGLDGVVLQEEEVILGTGGGLRRALAALRDEPLLVTNGDIYHTIDYREVYTAHRQNNCCATLAMRDFPRFNTVWTSGDRVIGFKPDAAGQLLAFTGLHVLEPHILASLDDGVPSCIIDLYRRLLGEGESIGVFRTDGCFWTDMGTPEDYLALHAGLLTGAFPRWRELAFHGETPFLISEQAELGGEVELREWCCLGRVRGGRAKLCRSVVWDGVVLPDGCVCCDTLVSTSKQMDVAAQESKG